MSKELGDRLKNLRLNQDMTAYDVIKKLKKLGYKFCLQSIYKWEHGIAVPKFEVLLALSKIYNCHISYLIEEKNLTYKNLTSSEIFLLRIFRQDYLFRSIATQIMRHQV